MSFLRRLLGRDDREAMDLWATPQPATPPKLGDIMLVDAGPKKIEVIKIVREATGLGLREAKDLVESVPVRVDAALRQDLERVGATVEPFGGVESAPAPPAAPAAATAFSATDVHLVDAGPKKIEVIKVVREATGLGLREAKDIVDSVPTLVASGLSPDAAAALRRNLEKAGARVG